MGRVLKILAILLILTVCVMYFAHPPILRELVSWLFVEDPLEAASAIIVLSGALPYRPLEAARLYKDGWAPRIVLTRGKRFKRYYALKALGLVYPEHHEVSRQVLLKLGVPDEAISVVEGEIHSTLSEAGQVLKALSPPEGTKLIVVTSKQHTRRARLIWNHVTSGQVTPIIRYPREDPTFVVEGWWRRNNEIEMAAHEFMGLINWSLGFPAS